MNLIKKYKFTILLILVVIFSGIAWNKISGNDTITGVEGGHIVDISELSDILELGYSAADVEVQFDTIWVETHYGIKIWEWVEADESIKTHKLTVTQNFRLKIGSDFSIAGNEVFLEEPRIISCENMPETEKTACTAEKIPPILYRIVSARCKAIAKATSIERGDLEIAKLDIEGRLATYKVKVNWTK